MIMDEILPTVIIQMLNDKTLRKVRGHPKTFIICGIEKLRLVYHFENQNMTCNLKMKHIPNQKMLEKFRKVWRAVHEAKTTDQTPDTKEK
jgi:hypothetical protein